MHYYLSISTSVWRLLIYNYKKCNISARRMGWGNKDLQSLPSHPPITVNTPINVRLRNDKNIVYRRELRDSRPRGWTVYLRDKPRANSIDFCFCLLRDGVEKISPPHTCIIVSFILVVDHERCFLSTHAKTIVFTNCIVDVYKRQRKPNCLSFCSSWTPTMHHVRISIVRTDVTVF